jgi:FK506-binding protein 4/5
MLFSYFTLVVSLIGRHGDVVFDQRELSFNLGEGLENNIPDDVEQALLKFKKQERSLIKLTPAYGFGSAGNEQLGVPPNANLEYEVELKSFEKAKESWSMDADEKLEQAKLCKEKGTDHFKTAKYALANKQYSKIVTLLEFKKSISDFPSFVKISIHFVSDSYLKFSSKRRESFRAGAAYAYACSISQSGHVLFKAE